jgi:hypothetical protein
MRAAIGKGQRDGAADATAAAGDNSPFPGQIDLHPAVLSAANQGGDVARGWQCVASGKALWFLDNPPKKNGPVAFGGASAKIRRITSTG